MLARTRPNPEHVDRRGRFDFGFERSSQTIGPAVERGIHPDDIMAIRVTVGETVRKKIGGREKEILFGEDTSGSSISPEELARRLGIGLSDSEGSLMVFVNGKMVAPESYHVTMIQDGDRVELMLPLSGG